MKGRDITKWSLMDCQLMEAIHKLWQNEFYVQKKSILIVESFLLHCNLSAKQNTVTSHRPLKTSCSQKQYLFYISSTTAESDLCTAQAGCLVMWRGGEKTESKIKITKWETTSCFDKMQPQGLKYNISFFIALNSGQPEFSKLVWICGFRNNQGSNLWLFTRTVLINSHCNLGPWLTE